MAFTTILRRTASSIIPFTNRVIGAQRSFCSSIITSSSLSRSSALPRDLNRSSLLSTLNFSTSLAQKSDPETDLVGTIESEIRDAEDEHTEVDKIPDGFPFKIKDEAGKQTISLERQYQGEVITVEVDVPLVEGEDGEELDENADNESDDQRSISLVVNVSKGSNEQSLEFGCTAYPDKITIDSMIMKDSNTSEDDLVYEGPDFSELDESLQDAFHKYLEERGINSSTASFLYDYMVNKENKEYLRWLKNVKNFIKN